MGANSWYYLGADQQQCGPISGAGLKTLAAKGQLKPTDLVRKEGSETWHRAQKVKGLFTETARGTPKPRQSLPKTSVPASSAPREVEAVRIQQRAPTRRWQLLLKLFFRRLEQFPARLQHLASRFQTALKTDPETSPRLPQEASSPSQASPKSPAEEWFYAIGHERHGPVSFSALKAIADRAEVRPTDLVWKAGFEHWLPAAQIAELFPQIAQSCPPPLPIQQAQSNAHPSFQIDKANSALPETTANQASPKSPTVTGCVGCLTIIVVLICAGIFWRPKRDQSSTTDVSFPPPSTRPIPTSIKDSYLSSFDAHPPAIVESLKSGREVWLILGWNVDFGTDQEMQHEGGSTGATYIVLHNDAFEYAISKTHYDADSPDARFYGNGSEMNYYGKKRPLGKSTPFKDSKTTKGEGTPEQHLEAETNLELAGGRNNPEEIDILCVRTGTSDLMVGGSKSSDFHREEQNVGHLKVTHNSGANGVMWTLNIEKTIDEKSLGRPDRKTTTETFTGIGHRVVN